MRYLSGSVYTLVVNIIPIIFLLYNDIVFHSAVEAGYAASVDLSRSGEDYSEYDPISEVGLGKKALIPKIKKLLGNKAYQSIAFGVVALIVFVIAVKSALGRKSREYMEFLSDLARLKELDGKLTRESIQLLTLFWNKPNPEFYDLEVRTQNTDYVNQMKNQFFRGTPAEGKKIKQQIWRDYLYPFFSDCGVRTKRQSGTMIMSIRNKLSSLGYVDPGLSMYDADGYKPIVIDEVRLFDLVAELKSQPNRRADYRAVDYFAENYQKFFALRNEYLMLKEKLFNFIATKHEDVKKCGFDFARSILAE